MRSLTSVFARQGSPHRLAGPGAWWARHPSLTRACAVLALLWMAAYLVWRVSFSSSGASVALWAALLITELYGIWNLAALTWLSWNVKRSDLRTSGEAEGGAITHEPTVDVFICTYDESTQVLEATLAGCSLLTYPHSTYLLDDGRRSEMRELASQWGAEWITRSENSHAKAGNINNALPLTDGELILVLDADHVPMPDALETLMRHFEDPAVGLVQSPHDFSNHDSVQHYGFARHEQSQFFSVICPGKDSHGAAFWCGSGALIRRTALQQIGGVATETIAEDFHTTIKLHEAGWSTRYESTTLLQGRAPHDLATYLLQRDRWARGNLAVFATPQSPLRAKRLTVKQRLSYLASLTSYLAGPVRLLLLCILAAVLWSGQLPLHLAPVMMLALWVPSTLLSIIAGTALARGTRSVAEASHFELCTAEIFTRALRCAVRPGRRRFEVSPKEGTDPGGWRSVRQFKALLVIAVLLSAGIALRMSDDLGATVLPAMHGVSAWFVPLLGAVELRRVLRTLRTVAAHRQMRAEYRAPIETAALLELESGTLIGRALDISPSGVGVMLGEPLPIGSAVRLALRLPSFSESARSEVTLALEVRSCERSEGSWRIGASIAGCNEQSRRRVVEYCHVIWPYLRLRDREPSQLATPSRARITATASGLLSIST